MRLIDSMYRNVPERQALRLLMYSIRSGDIARTRWSDVSDTDGGRYQDAIDRFNVSQRPRTAGTTPAYVLHPFGRHCSNTLE
jgi:hypothetical protein